MSICPFLNMNCIAEDCTLGTSYFINEEDAKSGKNARWECSITRIKDAALYIENSILELKRGNMLINNLIKKEKKMAKSKDKPKKGGKSSGGKKKGCK
jgi:hypothetical protein